MGLEDSDLDSGLGSDGLGLGLGLRWGGLDSSPGLDFTMKQAIMLQKESLIEISEVHFKFAFFQLKGDNMRFDRPITDQTHRNSDFFHFG